MAGVFTDANTLIASPADIKQQIYQYAPVSVTLSDDNSKVEAITIYVLADEADPDRYNEILAEREKDTKATEKVLHNVKHVWNPLDRAFPDEAYDSLVRFEILPYSRVPHSDGSQLVIIGREGQIIDRLNGAEIGFEKDHGTIVMRDVAICTVPEPSLIDGVRPIITHQQAEERFFFGFVDNRDDRPGYVVSPKGLADIPLLSSTGGILKKMAKDNWPRYRLPSRDENISAIASPLMAFFR